MTINELMRELSRFPPEATAWLDGQDGPVGHLVMPHENFDLPTTETEGGPGVTYVRLRVGPKPAPADQRCSVKRFVIGLPVRDLLEGFDLPANSRFVAAAPVGPNQEELQIVFETEESCEKAYVRLRSRHEHEDQRPA